MKKFITVQLPDGTKAAINVDHIQSIHRYQKDSPYEIHTDDTDFTVSDETAEELMRDLTDADDGTKSLSRIGIVLQAILDVLRARLH